MLKSPDTDIRLTRVGCERNTSHPCNTGVVGAHWPISGNSSHSAKRASSWMGTALENLPFTVTKGCEAKHQKHSHHLLLATCPGTTMGTGMAAASSPGGAQTGAHAAAAGDTQILLVYNRLLGLSDPPASACTAGKASASHGAVCLMSPALPAAEPLPCLVQGSWQPVAGSSGSHAPRLPPF